MNEWARLIKNRKKNLSKRRGFVVIIHCTVHRRYRFPPYASV